MSAHRLTFTCIKLEPVDAAFSSSPAVLLSWDRVAPTGTLSGSCHLHDAKDDSSFMRY